jgi:mono/diheme cytochrome c family protein
MRTLSPRAFLLPLLVSAFVSSAPAFGDETKIKLKEGPGRDKVEANCVACHSLDYIQTNSVFLNRTVWEAEVNKMRKVMGAPIKDEDVKEIVDYLTTYYGKP